MPSTLHRSERLRGDKVISALFDCGKGGFVYPLKYVFCVGPSDEAAGSAAIRVMVSVPKRNHKRANKRNLLKRRMRESYRLNKEPLVSACIERRKTVNLAFVYASKEVEEFKTIEHAIRTIISKLAGDL